MVDKAELLGAIAAGGSRAAAQYQQSLAALQSSNQDAIRQALSSSIAQSVPTEGQSQLAAKISQPYQNQSANLMAQQANSGDYFNRLGANAGVFADQANALVPAIEKRYELDLANKIALAQWEAANSGGGSGGGRSGGGGSGGGSGDDFTSLMKSLGGKENTKDYFSGLGDKYTARAKAIEAGVPEAIANEWYTHYASGNDEFADVGSGAIADYLAGRLKYTAPGEKTPTPVRNIKQLRNSLREAASQIPGDQHDVRRQLIQAAKRGSNKKKAKRGR